MDYLNKPLNIQGKDLDTEAEIVKRKNSENRRRLKIKIYKI